VRRYDISDPNLQRTIKQAEQASEQREPMDLLTVIGHAMGHIPDYRRNRSEAIFPGTRGFVA
jgi:hypothetical protein